MVPGVKLAFSLAGLAGLNVLFAFVYQWYILTGLGPGRETDALFAGMVVPQLFLAVISSSLTHVLVPLLTVQDEEELQRDAWSCFQGVGVLFGGVALLLIAMAPAWVPLTVPGFSADAQQLTVGLVRIQLVGMIFMALTGVLWSVYHARQRFLWVESSPLLAFAVGFPILVWGLPRFGVIAAAWALVAKSAVQTVFLMPALGRYHLPQWRSDFSREAWRRVRPLLLGSTYARTDQLVDRVLSSMAPPGALSLLYLAQQLYAAGHQVLHSAVAAPMVPQLARLSAQEDYRGFRRLSRARLVAVGSFALVALAGLVLAGRPALDLLFGHGRFAPPQISQLWWLMIALGGTWLGGSTGQILAASFYAQGDTITPTRIGVFGFTIGLVLKIGGFFWLGIMGIALASTIYYLLNAILLSFYLQRSARRAAAKPHAADTDLAEYQST